MKKLILGAALAATLAFGAGAAGAQTAPRNFETGSVWTIAYVETKPAMFNDYMAYLNGPWRAQQEAAKQRGEVLSYRILNINAPRDGEPNVMLLVEYRNMAVFDRSAAETDRLNAQIFGSPQQMAQSAMTREGLRKQRGGVLARELRFIR